MTLRIDRRSLVKGGAFGLGALLLPGGSAALAQLVAARGFTHNVASGEPSRDSVLLWTRYVGQGASAHVHAEVSDTADFRRIVAGGEVITGPWRDWTAKVTVAGLQPGRPYFYRFTANGEVSPIGRTRTLPEGRVPEWRMAVFSCANLPFGYFNAYAHAAARDDLHLGIHLGDYLYEYKRGTYPSVQEAVAARVLEPANELIYLADYRTRYACYRADPDLQALHARLPIIPSVDDHETANDSWEGGAENHNPGEGDYTERKIAAMQAWREWMPVSDEPYATYDFGDLGTYFRTETRTIGRSQAPSLEAALKGAVDPVAALKAFRDGDWADPARSMMGSTQEHWLAEQLQHSVRAKKRWQVLGVGTIVGRQVAPPEAANWISPDSPDYITTRVKAALLAAKLGLPSDLESWGGFPAARARLLQSAQNADADLVILAGDSHNAWGFELSEGGKRAAVEFDGHSVTSPGYESFFRQVPPETMSSALVRANPELKWCSTAGRGYMTVTLTPDAATCDWLFLDTVIGRSAQIARTHRMRTRAGRRMLETV